MNWFTRHMSLLFFARRLILLVFLLATFRELIFPQDACIIQGTVTDGVENFPLEGATVSVDRSSGVITNLQGYYKLVTYPGTYLIEYRFIGYQVYYKRMNCKAGDTITAHIKLVPERKMLDEIVVSASKYDQKLSDITVSMDVIKPRRLEQLNIASVEQVLNRTPGIEVMDGQPRIRGGSGYNYGAGSRVLILVDDLPLLSADAGDMKWEYIPVENLAQIEVIKGASSVLYGTGALNGVINFRTAYPKKEDPETKISVLGGIYSIPKRKELKWWDEPVTFKGINVAHSRKIRQWDLISGLHLFQDDGYRESEWEKRARFNLNTRYRFKKMPGLAAGVNTNMMYHLKTDFFIWQDADSGALQQNPEAVEELGGTRINIDPFLEYYDEKGNEHSLKTRYYAVINKFSKEPTEENDARLYYGEYKYLRNFSGNMHLTLGFTGNYTDVISEFYGKHQSAAYSVYSQYDASVLKTLKVSAGIRYERYWLDGGVESTHPVFRTGINWRVAPASYLRASFGQGYRFPSIAEKYTATSVSTVRIFPNPLIKSEKGWNAEIGLKQGVAFDALKGFLDLSVFWTEYKDMIEFTFGIYRNDSATLFDISNFGFKSKNVENARILGAELSTILHWTRNRIGINFTGGYTWLSPIDLDNKDITSDLRYLKYRYKHSAKADLEMVYVNWSVGISSMFYSRMLHIDKMFTTRAITELILPGFVDYWNNNNDPYMVFDARLNWKMNETVSMSLVGRNVLNLEYMGRPGDIRPPRNVSLQVIFEF